MKIPALEKKSEHYPDHFKGRVPKRIRMLTTVSSCIPFSGLMVVKSGVYEAWTNSHGAVSAVIRGQNLGVKRDEFEVVDWYENESKKAIKQLSRKGR